MEEDYCDRNELIPVYAALSAEKAADGSIRVVEVPVKPALIPCECEIHPWLQQVESRDPIADASAAVAEGDLRLWTRPVLCARAVVGVESSIPDAFGAQEIPGQTDVKDFSGEDLADCFESERLGLVAMKYAETYNRELLRLWFEKVTP